MVRKVASLGTYRVRTPRRAAELVEVGRKAAPVLAYFAATGDGAGVVRVAEALVAVANGNADRAQELVEDLLLEAKAR